MAQLGHLLVRRYNTVSQMRTYMHSYWRTKPHPLAERDQKSLARVSRKRKHENIAQGKWVVGATGTDLAKAGETEMVIGGLNGPVIYEVGTT